MRESLGQIVADSTFATEQCCVSLSDDKKWPIFECRSVGDNAPRFQLSTAAACKPSTPCTNRPILCPGSRCNSKVAIWSYSMEEHYREAHPDERMPPALQAQISLRYHERGYLDRDRRGKSKSKFPSLCTKEGNAPCACIAHDTQK